MPRLQQYNGPQVREQALQPVYQREIDVSSGLQQASRALNQISEVAERRAIREVETEANRIDTEISGGWLEWDAQNRSKYQGQNISEYEVAARKWWSDARKTYGANLSPAVQRQIGPALERKHQQALGSVLGHVNNIKERHADESAAAARSTAIAFGIDTGNPAGAAEEVRKITALQGARKGWTTEQVQAANEKELGVLHLAYISTLAERDPEAAQAYFVANKKEIPGEVQVQVEKTLKGERDNMAATQFAAERAGKPFSEQLADAATIADPELRKKTLTQMHNNQALVRQARAEQEAAASDEAWQLLGQGRRVPEVVLSRMNGRERVQLQDHLAAKAKAAASGTPVRTDAGVYLDLYDKIAGKEKVDLRYFTHVVALDDLKTLKRMQEADGPKQDSMTNDAQRVDAALAGLGIDKKKNPEDAARVLMEVDKRVREASLAKGNKDLTPDEKQRIVDEVAMDKVYRPRTGWFDPEQPAALLTPEEAEKAYVVVNGRDVKLASIPVDIRQRIAAALRATGHLVTNQNIATLYQQQLQAEAAGRKQSGAVK